MYSHAKGISCNSQLYACISASEVSAAVQRVRDANARLKSTLQAHTEKAVTTKQELQELKNKFRQWRSKHPTDDLAQRFNANIAGCKGAAKKAAQGEFAIEYRDCNAIYVSHLML